MKRAYWLLLGLLLSLPVTTLAQTDNRPVVAFVLERDLQTASLADEGPDGVSRLAGIFRDLGSQTRFVRLSDPLPEDIQVLVLARPLRNLPPESVARLWRQVGRGTHLLLAIDPIGYPDRRIDEGDSALGQLLTSDYGVSFLDTFLAEPWFSADSVAAINGSLIATQPDYLPHPILQPLAQYQVPIMTWGARTVSLEPWGIASIAHSLLITNLAFGEADTNVFIGRDNRPPLRFNIDSDQQGELTLAAVGENPQTGSRIAVLGDSEMLQNGFGLANTITSSGDERPRFPGNTVFLERLAAWLLEIPEADYPPLPDGFTWLAVDGLLDDWAPTISVTALEDNPSGVAQVRAFRNDEYLYIALEPQSATDWSTTFENLELTLDPQLSASPAVDIVADLSGLRIAHSEDNLPDAKLALSDALEMRIPLRVIGNNDVVEITRICLNHPRTAECFAGDIIVTRLSERDPVPLRISGLPLATITNPGATTINLRTGPGTDFPTVTGLPNGTIMAVVGRNAAADWIYVEGARYSGWLFSALATLTIEPGLLPLFPPE